MLENRLLWQFLGSNYTAFSGVKYESYSGSVFCIKYFLKRLERIFNLRKWLASTFEQVGMFGLTVSDIPSNLFYFLKNVFEKCIEK